MIQNYPDYPVDCVQSLISPWWVEADESKLVRGQLIKAFVPHVDQEPMALKPVGRTEATRHDLADCIITRVSVKDPVKHDDALPVAGLTCYTGECRIVQRAKKRPMVVVALAGDQIPKALRVGYPRYQTSPTHLALPYYGADLTPKRAGFSEEFLERIRLCTYRQFGWDMLPIGGSTVESVLRFDHLQPISTSFSSYEATKYRLSDEALMVIEEWLEWHFTDRMPESDTSLLNILREELNPNS